MDIRTKYSNTPFKVENFNLNNIAMRVRAYRSWYTRLWQGDVTQRWVPNVLSAVLCVASACGVTFVPESFQKALEDTFAEKSPKWVGISKMTASLTSFFYFYSTFQLFLGS